MTDASPMIYLDNNATTRTDPGVVAAMLPFFCDAFGNPSSGHGAADRPATALRRAREAVQALVGAAAPEEIVFTSGGSESDTLALLQAASVEGRDEILTSAVEHPAVLNACRQLEQTRGLKVRILPVDGCGRLDLAAYRAALGRKTALVSLMWANNETGTLFPVAELAEAAHAAGALFHTDAVQAAGKVPLAVAATAIDFLSLSAHKFHGPKGIGALYVRTGIKITPLILGGRQERGRRAGTENVPAIVGMGHAAHLALAHLAEDGARLDRLRRDFEAALAARIPEICVLGDVAHRLPGTSLIAFTGAESDVILHALNQAGICASAGSACMAGGNEPSHVLRAMHLPFDQAQGAVRFSLSRDTTESELATVVGLLPDIASRAREMSPFAAVPLPPLKLGT